MADISHLSHMKLKIVTYMYISVIEGPLLV